MRGSRFWVSEISGVDGIIPAHAGLTHQPATFFMKNRDHPRACGAHSIVVLISFDTQGSSPRMRGSPQDVLRRLYEAGIIPAHAGLTVLVILSAVCLRDHPRACGAHLMRYGSVSVSGGSSPRMRGSPLARRGTFSDVGIIPAHAGLTVMSTVDESIAGDHPRACGAH